MFSSRLGYPVAGSDFDYPAQPPLLFTPSTTEVTVPESTPTDGERASRVAEVAAEVNEAVAGLRKEIRALEAKVEGHFQRGRDESSDGPPPIVAGGYPVVPARPVATENATDEDIASQPGAVTESGKPDSGPVAPAQSSESPSTPITPAADPAADQTTRTAPTQESPASVAPAPDETASPASAEMGSSTPPSAP